MAEKILNHIELCVAFGESCSDNVLGLAEQLLDPRDSGAGDICNTPGSLNDYIEDDIGFLKFLINSLKSGKYEDVIRNSTFQRIVHHQHASPFSPDNLVAGEAVSKYLVDGGCEYIKQLHVLLSGIASLQLFVQYNWTGPRKNNLASLPNVKELLFGLGDCELKSVLSHLTVDGETVYHKVLLPELLLLSRILLSDTEGKLNSCITFQIWKLRFLLIYQQVISDKSSSIYAKLKSLVEDISGLEFAKEGNPNRLASVSFHVEAGVGFLYFSDVTRAKLHFSIAQKIAGIDINLSGALGKRTHFQQSALAQLVLRVSRCRKETADKSEFKEMTCQEFPDDVQLRDDTVMNKIKFLNNEDDVVNELHPEEQIVVLGLTCLIQKSNAFQDLVTEELYTFINSLICQPKIWCIHFKLLALRCRLEKSSSRRVERAMMQVQALLDAIGKDSPGVTERQFLFYCTMPSPHWMLEKELAYLLVSLGCIKAALEMFTRLEMWEDVVVCYQRLQRKDKAEAVVRKQLELGETPILWCLLGDCTDDPQFYLKAWELSGHRSARAQQSLGYVYFTKKEYKECIPFFQRSLEINSLQLKVWFSLAYAALQIEDFELAAKAYRTIVTLDPESFEAWNNLSKAYIKLKQKQRAWKTLQEALKCNYEEWKIWENYLLVCVDVGAFEDALNAYHRLLDIKGKFVDEEVLNILIKAIGEDVTDIDGQSAFRLRGKALELFGRITSCTPNNSEVWRLYANIISSDPGILSNQELLERVVQCLIKAHRCATQAHKWENDISKCKEVLKNADKLAEVCLNYTSIADVTVPSVLQVLNSVKLLLRNLIITVNKKVSDSLPDQTEELISLIQVLEDKLKNIMSLIEASA